MDVPQASIITLGGNDLPLLNAMPLLEILDPARTCFEFIFWYSMFLSNLLCSLADLGIIYRTPSVPKISEPRLKVCLDLREF
jgi:hypothetical protein